VARPGIAIEGAEVRHHLAPERIQVLEEVARTAVAAVEAPGVAGEETAHAPGEGTLPRTDQEVGVVREQRPGIDRPGSRLGQGREPGHEVVPVLVIPKDGSPLDASHHDMMEGVGRVQARLAWHGETDASRI
jgi:hypothetical protein